MTEPYLIPSVRDSLARLSAVSAGEPITSPSDLDRSRRTRTRLTNYLGATKPEMATITDHPIVADTGRSILIRVYDPGVQVTPSPALIYLHGGAFSLDHIDNLDHVCCHLAESSQLFVASIEYRLAPEHPYPAALEDSVAAIRWLVRNGKQWRLDERRLAIGGESTGATLALGASLRLDPTTRASIRALFLLYGCYHPTSPRTGLRHLNPFDLDDDRLRAFVDLYQPNEQAQLEPSAWPLLADLGHLPFLYIVACTADSLREHSQILASRAREAGQPHCLVEWPGMPHDCLRLIRGVPELESHLDAMSASLRGFLQKD